MQQRTHAAENSGSHINGDNTAAPAALAMEELTEDPIAMRLKDGIARSILWAQVLLVTVCMAYAETTDIPTLALCGVSVVSLVMLEVRKSFYDVAGWWPSLAVAGFAALLFVHMRMFLRKVDDMERVAEKYAAVDCSLGLSSLQELESGEEQVTGQALFQPRLGPSQVHGNCRSKTICRTNIGVCAFDPSAWPMRGGGVITTPHKRQKKNRANKAGARPGGAALVITLLLSFLRLVDSPWAGLAGEYLYLFRYNRPHKLAGW